MSTSVTDIPGIMRANSWRNGAKMLDHWFAGKSAITPKMGVPETSTIKMDSFVLTFPRAKAVFDQAVKDKVWINPAAQGEIKKLLDKKGMLGVQKCFVLGNPGAGVEMIDRDYIQYRVVTDTELDDLGASLGRFPFRFAIYAGVEGVPGTSRSKVEILKVMVYVRDSFDFAGSQHLGYWDKSDNSVSMYNPLSGTGISNSDFRDWRTANGKGGDFLVYSDVKVLIRDPPDVIEVSK